MLSFLKILIFGLYIFHLVLFIWRKKMYWRIGKEGVIFLVGKSAKLYLLTGTVYTIIILAYLSLLQKFDRFDLFFPIIVLIGELVIVKTYVDKHPKDRTIIEKWKL